MTDFLDDLPFMFETDEFATGVLIDGVDVKGIYTPAYEDAFGIESRNKQLLIQEAVKVAIGIDHESLVYIDGNYHRVRGIEPSGTGLVMLQLENDPALGPAIPVADAGQDQTIDEGDPLILDGSATTGGIPISYLWSKTSGGAATITSPSSEITTVTGTADGDYTFTLTATNPAGSDSSATDVTINAPPVDCATGWSDDDGDYAPFGLTAPVGTYSGSSYTWTDGVDPAVPLILLLPNQVDYFNIETTPVVNEISVDYAGQTTTGSSESIVGAYFIDSGLGQLRADIVKQSGVMKLAIQHSAGSAFIDMPSQDSSEIKSLSIESLGDGTARANAKQNGETVTTAPIDITGWNSAFVAAGWHLAEKGGTVTISLDSSTDQWVMTYPANAQDLCGNTKP